VSAVPLMVLFWWLVWRVDNCVGHINKVELNILPG